MKTCACCKTEQPFENYSKDNHRKSGLSPYCRTCSSVKSKVTKSKNKERVIRGRKLYYIENFDKIKAYRDSKAEIRREYDRKRREEKDEQLKAHRRSPEYRKRINDRRKERLKTDPHFKLLNRMQIRIYHAIKTGIKSAGTIKLIGCSIEYLKIHLEELFLPGMTWDNYGLWHVDHKKPCASFELSIPQQQFECFNFKNLQPLWARDNMSKKDKIL